MVSLTCFFVFTQPGSCFGGFPPKKIAFFCRSFYNRVQITYLPFSLFGPWLRITATGSADVLTPALPYKMRSCCF